MTKDLETRLRIASQYISFIIPAYNAEKYIETCVNSILDIKYDDIELIVVNDGSTDKTAAILSNIKEYPLRETTV